MLGAPEALVHSLAGRYRIDRELGAGGMATVYLARDLVHDREVAVKVLRPELGSVLGAERFLTEIKVTARLAHPHIVTVLDSGSAGGWLYYVLPFIRGESLRRRLDTEGRLGLAETLRIVGQVAGALDHAHREGIIHRDIKPENILLFEGEAMLSDFGIALAVREAGGSRLTSSGISLGTPLYMSPEQASGSAVIGPASDQFSLAAMTYEMLAGETPHAGATTHAVMARLLAEAPTPIRVLRPDLPTQVEAALTRALAKTPGDRFPTAGNFAAALSLSVPAADELPTIQYVHPPAIAPRRTAPVAAAGILVLGVVGTLIFARHLTPGGPITGRTVQITTSGRASDPVISPDGSQIAYVERACGYSESCLSAIIVRETGSEESRVIVDSLQTAFPYQWSEDGRWLLFNTVGGRLPAGQYAVSRLGGRIIPMGSGTAIFVAGSDTALEAESIASRPGHPVWIRILPAPWERAVDSFPILPPGGGLRLLAYRRSPRSDRWIFGWTNDLDGHQVLTSHRADGTITDSAPTEGISLFRWSTTGRSLILPMDAGAGTVSAFRRIAIDPSTGKFGRVDTVPLPPGVSAPQVYDLTPDGQTVVYASGRVGETRISRSRRTLDGRITGDTPVHTSTGNVAATITPNGRTIAYAEEQRSATGSQWRWWATTDGGPPRAIGPGYASLYTTAIDDDALYVLTYDSSTGTGLDRIDLASGDRTEILRRLPPTLAFARGAEGTTLVIRTPGDSAFLYDPSGTVRWRVGLPDSVARLAGAVASPDGRRFAFVIQPADMRVGADGNLALPVLVTSLAAGDLRPVAMIRLLGYSSIGWSPRHGIRYAVYRAEDPRPHEIAIDPGTGRATDLGPLDRVGCDYARDALARVCLATSYLDDIFLFHADRPLQ